LALSSTSGKCTCSCEHQDSEFPSKSCKLISIHIFCFCKSSIGSISIHKEVLTIGEGESHHSLTMNTINNEKIPEFKLNST
jgi:hypothetical protein